ncbi:universal stress protein [Mycobacterium stomatepiae]|uniref:Universal stress protein n=1 Tax=Mycobacterium stomatepiae TaxID=470076 RepID=A0A7I7Q230_9MYCO|nr:universal stress protein [Mycobacterium stomatepiae]MCV7166659.1 universal stress protein [Mycobacterium stomatepiae]BBY20279.1 universal stress protein [Mycobacterium stomatepiae]
MTAPEKRNGIVVGVDGSAASNAAVVWAARDAALRNVSLTLVHMFETFVPTFPQVPMPSGVALWQLDDGRQALEQAVKMARDVVQADRKVAITSEVKPSPAVPTLVEMSDDAEMIVVGSTGRGAVERVLLGSVSSAVVRGAKCPVAVIRPDAPTPPLGDHAPVLVGIDGSPASEAATAIAFGETSRRGVELVALHAWSDIEFFELPGYDWTAVGAEAERNLAECLAGWQERFPDVSVRRRLVRDRPARQLIEQSEAAQLVVLGSHGRGSLSGVMLGSVSNAVVHSISTPVIVARSS